MAHHSHKRDTNARPKPRASVVAGSIAVLATAGAVSLGVFTSDLGSPDPVGEAVSAPTAGDQATTALDLAGDSRTKLSRGTVDRSAKPTAKSTAKSTVTPTSESRVERLLQPGAKRAAIRDADEKRWTTAGLNLWTEPGDKARQTGEMPAGEKVLLTGRSLYGRDEIVWGAKQTRWVTAGYTTDEKPVVIGGDCTNGTTVPDGVSDNIKLVHAAVCAAFPDISVYGTFRGDGEHAQGIAVDIMVSGEEGYRVADFVREHYAELGVSYVIYSQRIWSVQRSSEGWRGMASRGSVTANHYDHVHVTTYY